MDQSTDLLSSVVAILCECDDGSNYDQLTITNGIVNKLDQVLFVTVNTMNLKEY